MAYFKFAKNTGNRTSPPKMFPIATATAIEKGEIVLFTPGTGIAAVAGTDFDDPAIGVAAEAHDGSTADGRQTGTEIKVYADPNDVFELRTTFTLTATGGSTTTFVDSTLLPQTNNLWKDGYLEIVSCAADSSLNGTMHKISSSTGATGTITVPTLPAALAAGDTAYIHPGRYAVGEYGWDLNSDGTDVDITTSGGEALQLWDVDPANKKSFWKLRLHQLGNDAAAK
jgi:hypothetical protein